LPLVLYVDTSSGAPDVGAPTSTQVKIRRAARQRRLIVGLTWGFSIVSFAATLMFLHWSDRGARADREPPGVFSANLNATPASVEAGARPVFRHSIVPGGVRSREEVVAAMTKDVVVKAHYVAVKPAALRQVQLSAPLKVHVSYRVGNNVYWTKRPLTVAAGEFVLTDGSVTIRERCGNLLSVQPLGPTQVGEPDPNEFDLYVQPLKPSSQSVSASSSRPGAAGSIPDVAVATKFRLAPSATEFGSPGSPFGGGPPATSKGPSTSGPGTATTTSAGDPPPGDLGQPPSGPPPSGPPVSNPPGSDPPGTNPPGTNPPGTNPPGSNPPGSNPPGSDPPTITPIPPIDPPGGPENRLQDVPLPVPEPATWTLVGIGLAAAGLRRYLKKPRARS